MQVGHMLASASHRRQPNASDNHTAPFGAALPLQVQNNRCVCASDVVIVVTVVVVLVMVSVVVIVVAAAVFVDILLFWCESCSGADRACEWFPAIIVGAGVVLLVVCVVVGLPRKCCCSCLIDKTVF